MPPSGQFFIVAALTLVAFVLLGFYLRSRQSRTKKPTGPTYGEGGGGNDEAPPTDDLDNEETNR
jgi:hypothetical protein